MKTIKYLSYIVLGTFALVLVSCEPKALKPDDVFVTEDKLAQELADENPQWGYKIYDINDFLDTFMSEEGDFGSDTCPYRSRSTNGNGIFLYTVDTIKTDTLGIYIRGRVSTDDFSGNFYKAMVLQQVVGGEQQNIRISVDMGSIGGLYQLGQELLIRCNGLAVGRYANQPQLCVPAYNNNVYAVSAKEKVGWAPGRIPAPKFRNAVRLIGTPDPSKLQYDVIALDDLFKQIPLKPTVNTTEMDKVRKADGRLVKLTGIHFTGEYYAQDGTLAKCVYAHPDSVSEANVFAPTTNNIGYPQGRIIKGSSSVICCSCSEYCKFANFFLPGAMPDSIDAVTYCELWEGSITGILGWYCDNATGTKAGTLKNLTGKEWSVTPRGIPGIGIADIDLEHVYSGDKWEDLFIEEFDPEYYNNYFNKNE